MAQLPLDPLKYLGNLPYFDASTNNLQNFCDLVDRIHPLLLQYSDIAQNIFIDIIKSKLKDRAKMVMDINCEATCWSRIKQILVNNFSDKKSCEELFVDLRNVVFKTNTFDFYYELMDKLRRLNNKTLITKGTGLALNESCQSNRRSALLFFINGLPEPMKSILVCRDPESIEEAMDVLFKAGYAYYGKDFIKSGQRSDSHEQNNNRNKNVVRNDSNRNNQQPRSTNTYRAYSTTENNRQQFANGNNNNRFANNNSSQGNRAGNTYYQNNNNNTQSNQARGSTDRYNNNNGNRQYNGQPAANNNPFSRNPASEPMEVGHFSAQSAYTNQPANFRSIASTVDYHI